MPYPAIPKLAYPPRLAADGQFAVVEQDTPDDIVGCVEAIARTPLGHRIDLPELGIPDPTGRQQVDGRAVADIERAVRTWEPRAAVQVTGTFTPDDPLTLNVEVRS